MPHQSLKQGTVHKIPSDLREVLVSDTDVAKVWEDLTPLARNEWICWVTAVKRPQTRQEHVQRVPVHLREGKRRPCCWAGCPHR